MSRRVVGDQERTGCGDASACLSVVDASRWRL